MNKQLSNIEAGKNPHVETLVRNGELRFHQLLEKLPAGAYTCDKEGLITYYNQHAVRLWGRRPALNDPVDRFCGSFRLFSADGLPMEHNQCWMAQALLKNVEFNGHEIIIEQPDGKRLTVLAHANPIHDEAGDLIGAVNVLVDITDRKLAENALREIDRSKNEFIATLAHELRNPLSPIRNAVKILQLRESESPETVWALDVIDRQTRQLTRLIDDLLDLARVTSNKLELRKERLELAEILNAAAEISRPIFEKHGQEFVIESPPKTVCLQGDLTRLAQALANLLNNAAKYTEAGGTIRLSAEVSENEVFIAVTDTGIGISSEVLPRIFEMFTQAEQALEKSGDGLGIGLTLAKRLVEMHGGTIQARSEGVNKGSSFIVRLPVEADLPDQNSPDENKTARSADAGGRRILVVDDNKDCAESLGILLAMLNNEVRQAYSGPEAIETAREFQPQIVFLDIGMPLMDGYETARRLREQAGERSLLLIALTGWGQKEDRLRSKNAGFDHHLTKPLDFDKLEPLLAETGF